MKRLVYSPKAFAWVQTQGQSDPINISEYIVRGRVERKVGEVSTAQIELRNPRKKFTTPGDPVFHPMDPVTVWLQRLKGYPVQVFTGYLDKSPYLQLYPGTCTLYASCTLKRLLHTYWDPALPYTRDFMAAYGWTVETKSGMLINTTAQSKDSKPDDANLPQIDDGSIGSLLFATLKHVGDWKDDTIFIEQLPPTITDQVAAVYDLFEQDNQEARTEITHLLKKIVGEGSQGGGGGDINTGKNPKNIGQIVKLIQQIAGQFNIPPEFAMATTDIESAYGQNMHTHGCYYGWYQMCIGTQPYGNAGLSEKPSQAEAMNLEYACSLFCKAAKKRRDETPSFKNESNWRSWAETTQGALGQFGVWPDALKRARSLLSQYGKGKTDPLDPNSNLPGGFPKEVPGGTILGTPNPAGQTGTQVVQAGRIITRPGQPPQSVPDHPADPGSGGGGGGSRGPQGLPGRQGDPPKPKIHRPIDGNVTYGRGWHEDTKGHTGITNTSGHPHWHSGVDADVPGGTNCIAPVDGKITMSKGVWSDGGMVHFEFTEDVGDIKAGTIIGWGHVEPGSIRHTGPVKGGELVAKSGCPSGGCHVHFIQTDTSHEAQGGGDGTTDPLALLKALQKGETSPTAGGSDSGGGSSGDILSTAKAAAFAATLEWPSMLDTLEAIGLQGPKSLMNDKPLFPFIEQLSGACLRNFQSMPNGNFYAFYPDYFGALKHRVPYWEISDLEIIDGGIDLSDESLYTHVYVVGDTVPEYNSGVNQLDRLVSGGVVNIFNAAQAGFVLQQPKDTKDPTRAAEDAAGTSKAKKQTPVLTDKSQAIKFLQKYGARPYLEEAPQIRSPYFEAFRAYQLFQQLWSQQFLTTFQFTFMPELYPGGLVAFPDHGIQCYIEEVAHVFDYENGFTTDANLSSPAALPNAPVPTNISNGMVTAGIAATRTGSDSDIGGGKGGNDTKQGTSPGSE